MALYIVRCGFDREADVWIVEQSDVPGLATEAPSFDELCRKINVMAPELLEANGLEAAPSEIAVEIIAHTTSKLALTAA